VAELCVNALLATKVTLITDGISFGTLRVNVVKTSEMIGRNCTNRTQEKLVYNFRHVISSKAHF
jgi:hypothetical protein